LNLELKFFFFKKNGKEREEDSLVSEACVVWSFKSLSFPHLLLPPTNTSA
jgi:hypothetical protein